jgi:hypothetical protein
MGSALPDPDATGAASQPLPPPAVSNKPAPGQTGPKGLAPRTTYTRVNTGAPPAPDAGSSGQKSQAPRGLEFLPAKVAHKEMTSMSDTTMFQRPNLQDLVKEAMEGTVQRVDLNLEAARQLAGISEPPAEKTKQASAQPEMTPTSYITKLAGALDYLSKQAAEGTNELGPGKGPNALDVSAATASSENIDAGQGGQAIAADTPPKDPAQQSSGVAKDPANAMQTNDYMMHGEQPVDPMGNEKTSAVYRKNLERLGFSKEALVMTPELKAQLHGGLIGVQAAQKAQAAGYDEPVQAAYRGSGGATLGGALGAGVGGAGGHMLDQALARKGILGPAGVPLAALVGGVGGGLAGGVGGYKALTAKYNEPKEDKEKSKEKKSSVLARNLAALGLSKLAEDAINPAQISAGQESAQGATPPPGAAPAEEGTPSEPSDVNSQKRLIDSNQAAIDYTKREAKADPKSDVNKVLAEPALSAAHDQTLAKTLEHTQAAGVKISHDLTKTAAAQALLYKLAEEACGEKKDAKKKEKQSQMAGLSNPSGQSGFSASSMGM